MRPYCAWQTAVSNTVCATSAKAHPHELIEQKMAGWTLRAHEVGKPRLRFQRLVACLLFGLLLFFLLFGFWFGCLGCSLLHVLVGFVWVDCFCGINWLVVLFGRCCNTWLLFIIGFFSFCSCCRCIMLYLKHRTPFLCYARVSFFFRKTLLER